LQKSCQQVTANSIDYSFYASPIQDSKTAKIHIEAKARCSGLSAIERIQSLLSVKCTRQVCRYLGLPGGGGFTRAAPRGIEALVSVKVGHRFFEKSDSPLRPDAGGLIAGLRGRRMSGRLLSYFSQVSCAYYRPAACFLDYCGLSPCLIRVLLNSILGIDLVPLSLRNSVDAFRNEQCRQPKRRQ